jgi:ABC-type lipoprotein release transport system permease subunit
MTLFRLVVQSLLYHWRGNSAVLLGVAVGTAVLTGALLVGDSIRGSLRAQTLDQLGWVHHSLVTGRFVRAKLADELDAVHASPIILLQGSASKTDATGAASARQSVERTGRITILGVDDRFWSTSADADFWRSANAEVVVNQALADDLNVQPGSTITLHLQKVSAIPRETLLGRREASEVVDDVDVTVHAVLADQGLGRFSLNPTPATPRNAFVPLTFLQDRLHQSGRANAMLAAGRETDFLQERLQSHLTLDDWGLILHSPESRTRDLFNRLDRNHDGKLQRNEWRRQVAQSVVDAADRNHDGVLDRREVLDYYNHHHPYLSLEGRQLLLEPIAAKAALTGSATAHLQAAPTLVYLANTISHGKNEIPYSIVAALTPSLPAPLGPFLPAGALSLADDEIVLADWKESPLRTQPGEKIALKYFEPEIEGRIQETTATFRLRGVIPLNGAADDPDLTPAFPGITDKLDIRDWNPPFPYDNKRVLPRDEHYWETYRATPKAYVTLATGQRLWGSRFGNLTSIRLAPDSPGNLDQIAHEFGLALLREIDPRQGGMTFDDVRSRGLESSSGSTDFSGLFLGFSFFLIAAALLLVGLLFRLNLDRRASEIGLLMASGYPRRSVGWLLLGEGSLIAVVGGIVGLAGALGYAWLMLSFLRSWWPGHLSQSFLRLHVTGQSLAIGYVAALLVSVLTIYWAVRVLGRVAPRALLAGETSTAPLAKGTTDKRPWSAWVSPSTGIVGLLCLALGAFLPGGEEQAMTFFSSGALLLIACLTGVWIWMKSPHHSQVSGYGTSALARLGVRNASRNRTRSLLTAGLLAAVTFLIVAVGSFYRNPSKDFLDKHGGSGGFALFGEADVPIYQDLNTEKGRDELNFPADARAEMRDVTFYPFRLKAGEDTSCLNLYQPRQPRLLGVPRALVTRGGFRFSSSEASTADERANPWQLLVQTRTDGAIPVFGDFNTVQWILHKGLGQEMEITDGNGNSARLRFVGMLDESIFQSELLLSEANFLKLFPRLEGHSFFLIEAPPRQTAAVTRLLDTALADHGFSVTPTERRLESYLAVENTYLLTFQALGGLGLVLGALGLAVVLMRSVWERRGELALLRALGYQERALGWLVLAENSFLLVLGLCIGALTALVSVAPHLVGMSGPLPWRYLVAMLVAVFVVGLGAGTVAVRTTLRAPLIEALRRE